MEVLKSGCNIVIENCVNKVNVQGTESAGGFIGNIYRSEPIIRTSYNAGTITGGNAGGIVRL